MSKTVTLSDFLECLGEDIYVDTDNNTFPKILRNPYIKSKSLLNLLTTKFNTLKNKLTVNLSELAPYSEGKELIKSKVTFNKNFGFMYFEDDTYIPVGFVLKIKLNVDNSMILLNFTNYMLDLSNKSKYIWPPQQEEVQKKCLEFLIELENSPLSYHDRWRFKDLDNLPSRLKLNNYFELLGIPFIFLGGQRYNTEYKKSVSCWTITETKKR